MLEMAPATIPPVSRNDDPQVFAVPGRTMRVALMTGCAQKALNTDINDATIRLLTRLGAEVVVPEGAGCCGALTHHMGKADSAHAFAAANIAAWHREMAGDGLDAVVVNTSGCGTTVKDYGHMFRTDPAMAEKAAAVSAIARDVSEVLLDLLPDEHGFEALPEPPRRETRPVRPARDGVGGTPVRRPAPPRAGRGAGGWPTTRPAPSSTARRSRRRRRSCWRAPGSRWSSRASRTCAAAARAHTI